MKPKNSKPETVPVYIRLRGDLLRAVRASLKGRSPSKVVMLVLKEHFGIEEKV